MEFRSGPFYCVELRCIHAHVFALYSLECSLFLCMDEEREGDVEVTSVPYDCGSKLSVCLHAVCVCLCLSVLYEHVCVHIFTHYLHPFPLHVPFPTVIKW